MPVLMLAVAMSVEVAGAIHYRQRLLSAAELTCRQSALYLQQQAEKFDRNTAAETSALREMAHRNLIMLGLDAEPYPLKIDVEGQDVAIALDGLKKHFVFRLSQLDAIGPKVRLECMSLAAPATADPTSSTAVVTDSFENHSRPTDTSAATIAYGNWRSDDGFRIMGENSSAGTAAEGRFSIKLDIGTNSFIERDVRLDQGDYELIYSYKSTDADSSDQGLLSVYGTQKICGRPQDVAWADAEDQTYGIAISIGPDAETMQILDVCVWSYGWVQRRIQFRTEQTFYILRFDAIGRADGIGGVIDNVIICRDTCQ